MMSKIVLDVLTLGDLMVDFTPAGISPKGNLLYERNPGGAPANVAVTVSRLGGKSGFLGTVSDDIFGHFLADAMTKFGVNIQGLRFTRKAPTKMAFITLDENNNRSFDFPRGEVAETYYSPEDIPVGTGEGQLVKAEGDNAGWSWQGYGDNGGEIQKIKPHWYYYKCWF